MGYPWASITTGQAAHQSSGPSGFWVGPWAMGYLVTFKFIISLSLKENYKTYYYQIVFKFSKIIIKVTAYHFMRLSIQFLHLQFVGFYAYDQKKKSLLLKFIVKYYQDLAKSLKSMAKSEFFFPQEDHAKYNKILK